MTSTCSAQHIEVDRVVFWALLHHFPAICLCWTCCLGYVAVLAACPACQSSCAPSLCHARLACTRPSIDATIAKPLKRTKHLNCSVSLLSGCITPPAAIPPAGPAVMLISLSSSPNAASKTFSQQDQQCESAWHLTLHVVVLVCISAHFALSFYRPSENLHVLFDIQCWQ